MTDPRYMRMAKAVKDELGALDVVLLVHGRSGLFSIGHSGPDAERLAYAALDAALDAMAARRPTEAQALLSRIALNARPVADPAMGGLTDTYTIPMDDLEAVQHFLRGGGTDEDLG